MQAIKLQGKFIGQQYKPFIIAEMSGNHNQSLEHALKMVDAAAEAGVDALKLQTYTADTMTLNLQHGEFRIEDTDSLWHGYSLYELYQKAHTPWDWHEPIFNRCKERGIIGFSTPFDASAVDFLETLNVPCYKIASFENTDISLIRKVAATRKPIIISSGMAKISELDESVRNAGEAGCEDLILLKCTSSYPADAGHSNLKTLRHMQETFNCLVGLSDHTLGIGVAIASVALGGTVIEKHFTLSRADEGIDAKFSLEPQELKMLVEETQRAWKALGQVSYGPSEVEQASLQFRRSLYVVEDIQAGDKFSEKNIRAIRPGLGIPPKYLPKILGKNATKDIKKGTPFSWELM